MKLICRSCNGLVEEEKAIKLSVLDYDNSCEKMEYTIKYSGQDIEDSQIFTQVCEDCYNSDWKYGSEQCLKEKKSECICSPYTSGRSCPIHGSGVMTAGGRLSECNNKETEEEFLKRIMLGV